MVTIHIRGLITLLITTHELPSRLHGSFFLCFIFGISLGNPKKELLWSLWVELGFRDSTSLPLHLGHTVT